jgi:hypothetical protein
MTNLYDFLRRILNDPRSPITEGDVEWLQQYLESPGHEIHFKAHQVGEKNGEPVYSQHYAIAGGGEEVFSLLTEAMLQNPSFANQVVLAARFWFEHLPFCDTCKTRFFGAQQTGQVSWIFSPHKPLTHG